ncbi:MAG: hypothetical protein LBD78_00720 [Spirochaetaceae bacterium]|nr:hypothetical protein [Spirochaetaceae bacterium]
MRKKEGPKLTWGRAKSGLWILMIFALCAGLLLLGGCPLANDPEDSGMDLDEELPNPSGHTGDPEEQSGPDTTDDSGTGESEDPAAAGDSEDSADPAGSGDSEDSIDPAESGDSEDSANPAESGDSEDSTDPAESEHAEEPGDSEGPGTEEEPEDPGEYEEEPAELILHFKKPVDRGISVEGLPKGTLRLSQTGKDDQPRELRFRITGYTQSACWVDGKEVLSPDGEYVISALNYSISRHVITCMGILDGIPYGREIQFIITE